MGPSINANRSIRQAVRTALRRDVPKWMIATSMMTAGGVGPVSAQAPDEPLEEVIVTTEFFRPTEASSATKFDLPVKDTPQSISVLTDDVLRTFDTKSLLGVDKFIAGLHSSGTDANVSYFTGFMQARGFVLDELSGYKINGFSTIREFQPALSVAERVEFVKGPSSVVYGVNNYGGTINTVLKAPKVTSDNQVSAYYGSYGSYGAMLDSTGSIDTDGRVRYRVVGEYEDRESIKDGFKFERYPLYGRLQWDVGEATTLDTYVLYQKEKAADDFGAMAIQEADGSIVEPFGVNRHIFLGVSDYNNIERESVQFFGGVTHHFANGYTGGVKVGYAQNTHEYQAIYVYNYGFFNVPFVDVYTKVDSREIKSKDVELSFGGDFELFGRTHKLMLLGEARFINYDFTLFPFDNIGTVDQFNPDWSTLRPLDFDYLHSSNGNFNQDEDRYAVGAQALFNFTDKLSMLVGLRWDHIKQNTVDIKFDPDPTDNVLFEEHNIQTDQTKTKLTPRLGLVYKLTPNINAYVSYSQGFIPQEGTTRSGGTVDPEEGVQYEGGFKGEFADGKLGASIIGYYIKRKDVAVPDPENALDESFVIGGREQNHKGFELELFGMIAPHLNVIATYSYLDTEITNDGLPIGDPSSSVGNRVGGAPKNSGSLFFEYEIQNGPLAKLSLSAGAAYVGKRTGQEVNISAQFGQGGGFPIFFFSDYTTVDAGLIYRGFERLELSLQATNLLDEDYFNPAQVPNCCGPTLLQRGTSREVNLGVLYRF